MVSLMLRSVIQTPARLLIVIVEENHNHVVVMRGNRSTCWKPYHASFAVKWKPAGSSRKD